MGSVSAERKPCTLLDETFEVALLAVSPDGYWKRVAIKKDGRQLWVTALAVRELPANGR